MTATSSSGRRPRLGPVVLLGVLALVLVAAGALLLPAVTAPALRPVAHVEVLDPDESWFGQAELYLSVRLSSQPEDVRTLIPLNIGPNAGDREVFVALPYRPAAGDVMLFNLLDEDRLTDEEQERLLTAARAAGYALWIGNAIYAAEAELIIPAGARQAVTGALDLAARTALVTLESSPFDSYGSCEYIVPAEPPRTPRDANRLSLLDQNYARVALRLYFTAPRQSPEP